MSDTQLGPKAQRPHREHHDHDHDHHHKEVAPVIASAFVNAGGVLVGNSPGILSVTHTAASGIYALVLAHPPADPNNITVAATIADFTVGAEITWIPNVNEVIVCTYTSAGVLMDKSFSIVVSDRS